MHTQGVTLFLVGVAVIGLSPIAFLAVYLRRRAVDARGAGRSEAGGEADALGPAPSWRRVLVTALAGIAVLAVGIAWYVGTHGAEVPAMSEGMQGMATGGQGGFTSETAASPSVLPGTLAGLELTGSVTGPDAVRQVSALHDEQFPITSAEVARYASGRAMVWVSWSADAATAKTMVEQMAAKISQGGSPFDEPEPLSGEKGVWVTRGMGQEHFFFSKGNAVWWISADGRIARRALSEIQRVAA